MRIAILVGGLPSWYNGGTEVATVQIAKYAARLGHDVHVIAADGVRRNQEEYKKLEDGFQVHRVGTIARRYLHGIAYIPQATRKILELKPDVVHVQALYMAPSAMMTRELSRIPYIFYERGGIGQNSMLNRALYPMALSKAKRIIAQTAQQSFLLSCYTSKNIEVIPNGVELERFGKISKTEARSQLGLPEDARIILTVGRCRPEKNMSCFVEAAGMDVDLRHVYVLVGDGPEMSKLEKLAHGRVRFEGSVDNELIPTYMAAADVLVNTSHFEGFPNVFLEAMAAGLPVVAPKVSGIPEIVEEGVNGILTLPGSAVSTRAGIGLVLRHREWAARMSLDNRKKAEGYTWERVVEKLYGMPWRRPDGKS